VSPLARLLAPVLLVLGCASSAPPHESAPAPAGSAADAILVLGHRPPLDRAGVEYETRARVDRGIALWRAGRAPQLLFSGGQSTEQAIEADVMAAYARERGVPPDAILRERASRDTIENVRMSVALLRAELRLDRAPHVVLVTSDYHSDRATRLLRCAGAHVQPEPVALTALSPAERKRKLRSERWVRFAYAFIDECGRARSE
jgi:uncharacterized SAM-binding protein YcdF (DUF218 family)